MTTTDLGTYYIIEKIRRRRKSASSCMSFRPIDSDFSPRVPQNSYLPLKHLLSPPLLQSVFLSLLSTSSAQNLSDRNTHWL